MTEPDSPVQLSREDWRVILTRTVHEYRIHQVVDLASALTYTAVLAMLPALIALLALIGLVGDAEAVATQVLEVIDTLAVASAMGPLREVVDELLDASHAATAFVIGAVGAVWATSGFVATFGRGMNRIYRVEEGRRYWFMQLKMVGVAAIVVVLMTVVALALLLTGPAAESAARTFGLDEGVVFWWDLGKLPVLAAIGIAVIALLYWAAPNVKRRHLRWFSVGAGVALLSWVGTTTLFGAFAFTFGTFEGTYRGLGVAVAFLLWVWLSNLALLFGAVLDTEVERARQLRAGIAAEERVQLPLRSERRIERNREQREADIRASAAMRAAAEQEAQQDEEERDHSAGEADTSHPVPR